MSKGRSKWKKKEEKQGNKESEENRSKHIWWWEERRGWEEGKSKEKRLKEEGRECCWTANTKTVAEEEEGRTRRSGSRDVSFMSSAAPRLSSSPETAMQNHKDEEEKRRRRRRRKKNRKIKVSELMRSMWGAAECSSTESPRDVATRAILPLIRLQNHFCPMHTHTHMHMHTHRISSHTKTFPQMWRRFAFGPVKREECLQSFHMQPVLHPRIQAKLAGLTVPALEHWPLESIVTTPLACNIGRIASLQRPQIRQSNP